MCYIHFSNGVCNSLGVMGKITVTGFAHTMGTGGEYNQSLNKIASSADIHI